MAMSSCAGSCPCMAAGKGQASAIAVLRVARSLSLPPPVLLRAGRFEEQAAAPVHLKIARWPLQLGAARIVSNGPIFSGLRPSLRQQSRSRGFAVVSRLSSSRGWRWISPRDTEFWQAQVIRTTFCFPSSSPSLFLLSGEVMDCLSPSRKPGFLVNHLTLSLILQRVKVSSTAADLWLGMIQDGALERLP